MITITTKYKMKCTECDWENEIEGIPERELGEIIKHNAADHLMDAFPSMTDKEVYPNIKHEIEVTQISVARYER